MHSLKSEIWSDEKIVGVKIIFYTNIRKKFIKKKIISQKANNDEYSKLINNIYGTLMGSNDKTSLKWFNLKTGSSVFESKNVNPNLCWGRVKNVSYEKLHGY
uniref:Uncharacterized protein n=1 Tax=Rhizophagus irregularis (strain DAOM 181602 / DAOM 197198 / MUCL 43194) TaxID=747089 RepID=U9T9G0_RHIID